MPTETPDLVVYEAWTTMSFVGCKYIKEIDIDDKDKVREK